MKREDKDGKCTKTEREDQTQRLNVLYSVMEGLTHPSSQNHNGTLEGVCACQIWKREGKDRQEKKNYAGGLLPIIQLFGCDICLFVVSSITLLGPEEIGW